jgi:hypothetical protein
MSQQEPTALVLVSEEFQRAAVDIRRAAALPAEDWPDERIRTIARTVAPADTSLSELSMFLGVCSRYELDPVAGEAWLVKDEHGKISVLTGRDTMQKVASRDPDFEGIEFGVVYEKDEYQVVRQGDALEVHSIGSGFERGQIAGAWAIGRRKGKRPVFVERRWKDYSHLHRKRNWKNDPAGMIETRVITAALRRMYVLAGIFTPAEMEDVVVDMGEERTAGLQDQTRARMEGLRSRMAERREPVEVEAEVVEESGDASISFWAKERIFRPENPATQDDRDPHNSQNAEHRTPEPDSANTANGSEHVPASLDATRKAYFAILREKAPDWGDVERKLWQDQHGLAGSTTDWQKGQYLEAIRLLEAGDLAFTYPEGEGGGWPQEEMPI